jgi:hypothetical protein
MKFHASASDILRINWPRAENSANCSIAIVRTLNESDAFSASAQAAPAKDLTSNWRHPGAHRAQAIKGHERAIE